MIKFAFSSNAFTRHSLSETIGILAEIGYDGIEIMADVPHAYPTHLSESDIDKIRNLLAEKGLAASNLNAFMHNADGDTYHPSWIEKDPSERARRINYTLRCIDLAHRLGAPHISTEPGGPLEGISRSQGLAWFKEGLNAIAGRAREKGIKVLIEPEPGLLIERSPEFLELYSQLDSDVFGLNFDIGHFYCVGEDPRALVRELKDCAFHFHLEDIAASGKHRHLQLGEGAIDIPGVLSAIEGTGFEGFVTVELYTYYETADAAARDAMNYLRELRKGPAKQVNRGSKNG